MTTDATRARVIAITQEAASLAAAVDAITEELGADIPETMGTLIAATWHERNRPAQYVAPPLETFTTFTPPAIIDPFVEAIRCANTRAACFTHKEAAHIFSNWHTHCIRRCKQTGHWYVWNGQRWLPNSEREVIGAISTFLDLYGQAALKDITPMAKGMAKQATINSSAFLFGTFKVYEYMQEISVEARQLDPDDWALNTPMGIADLRTGELMPHTPEAMCTKMTVVSPISKEEYQRAFPRSRFAKFLQEIFSNTDDEAERNDLIRFEQQSLGYCLTGDSSLHFLKFWYGEGRNGKSTLGEVVEFIMGDYAKKINNALLMTSRNDKHPTEIANLMGARLVIASEITEGAYLNESMVKELTGDAQLSARFMHHDFFEFRRTHKHLIYGNHKPRLRVTDAAIKARLKLTEFGVNFEANGQLDAGLKLQLLAEGPIIITWLIQGLLSLCASGLKLPRSAVVERGTNDYMAENDVVRLWIEERCQIVEETLSGTPVRSKMQALYEDYREWRIARGEHPEAIQRWSQVMQGHGFKVIVVRGTRCLGNVGLKSDRDDF
jgi:putative DNA primase/helicase